MTRPGTSSGNRGSAQASASPARLEVEHLSVAYSGHLALDDVTFEVPPGARVAVVGPNGAGKSTLLKALVGLVPITSGQIRIHGQPLGHHVDCVAYVPQQPSFALHFPVTVRDVVTMGRYGHLGPWRQPEARDRAIVQESLELLGIAQLADRPIASLSGGQLQRARLARALAQQPHILLLDEPLSGVDVQAEAEFLEWLDVLARQEVTVLVAIHDLVLARERFETVVLLNRRLIACGSPSSVISPQPLAAVFGSRLVHLPSGGLLIDECRAVPPSESQR